MKRVKYLYKNVSVHLLSVVLRQSWPLQKSLLVSRFVHEYSLGTSVAKHSFASVQKIGEDFGELLKQQNLLKMKSFVNSGNLNFVLQSLPSFEQIFFWFLGR